ncbi:MAG: sigma-70 family RNA polymerase sigma factor, partial [Candidatus Cloacimonetes bacterium]|nr:sigma-70 family RNA polymerase sigma factor [Candidatus Cloacimonadota bacterium]
YPLINRFVYHRVNDEAQRHEIVSDVFYKALNRIKYFVILRRNGFSSWLYKIAVNEINMHYRRVNRDSKLQDKLIWEETDSETTESYPLYNKVRLAMSHLDENSQSLLALRFFEKLTYSEIGKIYGKREGAVKVKAHRAMKKLRALLREE